MRGEAETRAVLQLMHAEHVINDKMFSDMNSCLKDDGTLAVHAGIIAAVENTPKSLPAKVVAAVLSLRPFLDEEDLEDLEEALGSQS